MPLEAMNALIFFLIIFSSILLNINAFEANSSTVICSHGASNIRFPFRVKGQQHRDCGHPGYELVCEENITMIHFPSYGNLVVKSISYNIKKLDLLDPKNCVHEVFLNLNLSLTPFQYYYVVKNYTYLNCSARLSPSFAEIPCLSGSKHHVYTVESSLAVPDSCRPVKTIAIPLPYSPYLSDSSFGLGLTWDLPGCDDCEDKTGAHDKGLSSKHLVIALSSSIFVFMVIILISIKINHSEKLDNGQMEKGNPLEAEKLLGDHKALKLEGCYNDNISEEVSIQFKTGLGLGDGNCGRAL